MLAYGKNVQVFVSNKINKMFAYGKNAQEFQKVETKRHCRDDDCI